MATTAESLGVSEDALEPRSGCREGRSTSPVARLTPNDHRLPTRLGVVTGLADEARIGRIIGDAYAGGGTPFGAEIVAERLVARGALGLVSFGLCGGLDPTLLPGNVIVPLAVLETGGTYPTDPELSKAAGGWSGGLLLAAETMVVSREAKRRLFETTRAAAVDLESGAVARVAVRHGLPFTVIRAICDTARRTLPPASMVALDANGRVRMARVLSSIVRRPGQIPDLVALARDAAVARRALVRVAAALAARLAVGR